MIKLLIVGSALMLTGTAGYLGLARIEQRTERASSDLQTRALVDATTTFLRSLNTDQRRSVQFDFTPGKTATIARFHRTPDGGVAPGAPAGGESGGGAGRDRGMSKEGGPDGGPRPGGGPGDPGPPGGGRPGGGGFGMGPPNGFIGEQYGKAVWSNYPVSDVLRPGLRLGSLTTAQREAAMHLLAIALSPMGYQKVLDIMGSDDALAAGGTNFASGAAVYTIGIFGEPSASKPWMIEFGGHHLGLNLVIAGHGGVMTPTLTGAQPSVYKRGGETVRVLARENDEAFALLDALSEEQRRQATLNYRVGDLVLGPGEAAVKLQPEGLKGSELNDKQRKMLLDLIWQWAGIVNEAYAKPRMYEIGAELNDTYFAWSGPATHEAGKNGGSYYRVQGPKVVIEFSPQGVGGDPTMHVHTIYRDPTNDYGVTFTGAQ